MKSRSANIDEHGDFDVCWKNESNQHEIQKAGGGQVMFSDIILGQGLRTIITNNHVCKIVASRDAVGK